MFFVEEEGDLGLKIKKNPSFRRLKCSLLQRENKTTKMKIVARTTTEIHKTKDSKGVPRLKDDARAGGQIAGTARKQIERKIGRSVITKNNFLRTKDVKKLKK